MAGGTLLRVLITNLRMDQRTGTEMYVRDLALSLLAHGHTPIVYSPLPGQPAQELRNRTIPVVDDLDSLGDDPDVIHGHHAPTLLTALVRFPGVPAVSVCHDFNAWHDCPLPHPRIRRYVAVD